EADAFRIGSGWGSRDHRTGDPLSRPVNAAGRLPAPALTRILAGGRLALGSGKRRVGVVGSPSPLRRKLGALHLVTPGPPGVPTLGSRDSGTGQPRLVKRDRVDAVGAEAHVRHFVIGQPRAVAAAKIDVEGHRPRPILAIAVVAIPFGEMAGIARLG